MPTLDEIKCPVCGVEFAEGDDVVYCPDCGTPHHRACYNMAGHCVNARLHGTGFIFNDGSTVKEPAKQEKNKTTAEGFYVPKGSEGAGEKPQPSIFAAPSLGTNDLVSHYEKETLDGEKASYYAAAVRTNVVRFMNIFKKFDTSGKKASWNWGAFFFGPYYLLFRKMYSHGIGLMIIETLVSYLGSYFMSVKAPIFTKMTQDIFAAGANTTFRSLGITQADINAVRGAADYQTAVTISIILVIVLFLIRIIAGALADKIYFSRVKNLIKTVSEKIDEGASVSAFINAAPVDISGEKAKLYYLSAKGGTSLFAALIGYLALSIIMTL